MKKRAGKSGGKASKAGENTKDKALKALKFQGFCNIIKT